MQPVKSSVADANFWNDPEAAQIVLRSGAKITLVGMDVTMKVLLTKPMREQPIGATPTSVFKSTPSASRAAWSPRSKA